MCSRHAVYFNLPLSSKSQFALSNALNITLIKVRTGPLSLPRYVTVVRSGDVNIMHMHLLTTSHLLLVKDGFLACSVDKKNWKCHLRRALFTSPHIRIIRPPFADDIQFYVETTDDIDSFLCSTKCMRENIQTPPSPPRLPLDPLPPLVSYAPILSQDDAVISMKAPPPTPPPTPLPIVLESPQHSNQTHLSACHSFESLDFRALDHFVPVNRSRDV